MLLEFKTARNKTNGARKYLTIDTEAKVFSRVCPYYITEGVEVSASAYRELIDKCERYEFEERSTPIF